MWASELTPNYKATGQDGLKGEFIRYLGEKGFEVITNFFNLVYSHQITPSAWRKDVAWPLHKAGNKRDPTNYRLITLMAVLCKVFERVMHARLVQWRSAQQDRPIDRNQVGFQASLCTLDHIYTLTETIRLRARAKKPTYVCFVDARKAFPSVFKAGLLFKLHKIGVTGRFWRMVKSMYQHITTRILTRSSRYTTMSTPASERAAHFPPFYIYCSSTAYWMGFARAN